MPTISVITPVYNTAVEYLREAVDSILKQSYQDFEFILIDDCSKNADTLSFLHGLDDPRIKTVFLRENGGAAHARNVGLEKSSGEFIAFMDSDDVADPARLEVQIAYMKEHPECGCLGSDSDIIGDDCNFGGFPKVPNTSKVIELYQLFCGNCYCMSSVMVRKQVLSDHGIRFQDKYIPGEDYGLWLSLVGLTHFALLPNKLVSYRWHFENISHLQQQTQIRSCMQAQHDVLVRLFGYADDVEDIAYCLSNGRSSSFKVLQDTCTLLKQVIDGCTPADNISDAAIRSIFLQKVRNIFYHSKGMTKQLYLFSSPLSSMFHLPLYWRLWCLLTRGFALSSERQKDKTTQQG